MASFPECTVCKKPFRWKGPDPYLLPCLHAVCETCVTAAGGCIHCPRCQKDVEKTKLKTDKVRQRLILHLTVRHDPTEILCTHSDDGNQAVCWCQECQEFLCEHCQNLHEEFKATRRHEVQGITEIGTSEVEEESYCSVHTRYALELMDHDCGILICYKCTHGAHAGHSVEDISLVAQANKHELQELLTTISAVKNTTQKLLDGNNEDALRINETASSQKEIIGHTFDTMKSLLHQRQKEVILEFDTRLDKARVFNSEQRMALCQHQRVSSHILEYTKHIIDHASGSDLPVVTGIVREAVKECLNRGLHEKEQGATSLTFVNEDPSHLKKAISTFSGIVHTGHVSASEAGDIQQISFTELKEKSRDLELKVATLQNTIEQLKRDKTCIGASPGLLQRACENLGIKSKATCHLLKSVEESIGSFILNCVNVRFNSDIVNLDMVHIGMDGELCNQQEEVSSLEAKRKETFDNYSGTSSSAPLLSADYLQYWETQANVRLNQLISTRDLLLEIGVCWKGERDEHPCMATALHSYRMCLLLCDIHSNSICRRVEKESGHVLCLPNAFPHRPGITNTVHYGVVFDYTRRKLAFLDVKEMTVIAVLDSVDTSQPLWPMFGVFNPCRGSVTMKLLTGKDITMTTDKKALVLEAIR